MARKGQETAVRGHQGKIPAVPQNEGTSGQGRHHEKDKEATTDIDDAVTEQLVCRFQEAVLKAE